MIAQKIKETLKDITGIENVILTSPESFEHGDYTTNIAMQSFKLQQTTDPNVKLHQYPSNISGKSPIEMANNIVSLIKANIELASSLEKIEVAGPGFINFFVSSDYLKEEINDVLKKASEFGNSEDQKEKKIIVEFTDPNPFKEFHIGHLYSNTVGESISRLLESQGANVRRVCYQGDVGLHVAKAIWGLRKVLQESGVSFEDLSSKDLKERIAFLAKGYSLGSKIYEEDEGVSEVIKKINKEVFEGSESVKEMYDKGRAWSLEYFDTIYKRVGMHFDAFYFESVVGKFGVEIVNEYLEKGIFEKSDGAIVFPGEKYGLHTRVFINKLGLPTYEAKELGLAPKKYEDFEYEKSIIITGNEINEYFKVLIKALSLIKPELAQKTHHIGHGMVRLPEGKMSSRTGNVILGESLLNDAKNKVKDLFSDSSPTDELAEQIGQAAIKYAFLKNNIGGDIEFSLTSSVSFNGNSGPYLQYTAVRINSLIEKSGKEVKDLGSISPESKNLVRFITRLPEVVTQAAQSFKPSHLAEYLFELAQEYNNFYDNNKIIGSERDEEYLTISLATRITITNGLKLLGISVPEKM